MEIENFVDLDAKIGWAHYRNNTYGPFIKCGYNTGKGFKPLIYFSSAQKCWKVAHMNRSGEHWRAYLAAFNFCHKLNIRLMER